MQRALQRATSTQEPVALYIMGLCIMRGVGGYTQNPVVAKGWFTAASEKHHRTSLYQLGTLAEVGLGAPADLKQAEQYYRRGADLGSDHAGTAMS